MKAIRVHQYGGVDALKYEEIPVPEPGAGEARVRIEAAGVNYIDVYQRTGLYQLKLPFTLGMEAAGTVDGYFERMLRRARESGKTTHPLSDHRKPHQAMNLILFFFRRPLTLFMVIGSWLFAATAAHAQSGTGSISGRVFNPSTGEYVRNAEVRVQGTNELVTTGSDGSFTLSNVPAGSASLSVSYTGYLTAVQKG